MEGFDDDLLAVLLGLNCLCCSPWTETTVAMGTGCFPSVTFLVGTFSSWDWDAEIAVLSVFKSKKSNTCTNRNHAWEKTVAALGVYKHIKTVDCTLDE